MNTVVDRPQTQEPVFFCKSLSRYVLFSELESLDRPTLLVLNQETGVSIHFNRHKPGKDAFLALTGAFRDEVHRVLLTQAMVTSVSTAFQPSHVLLLLEQIDEDDLLVWEASGVEFPYVVSCSTLEVVVEQLNTPKSRERIRTLLGLPKKAPQRPKDLDGTFVAWSDLVRGKAPKTDSILTLFPLQGSR